MSVVSGYTQGAICTFARNWASKVYSVTEDITDPDGLTVRCRVWLPIGREYDPQNYYVDVAFQRRRRVYMPAPDAQEGSPRDVALELDYESGVLAINNADAVTTVTENSKTVAVIT